MNVLVLIIKEIRHRKTNFLLTVLAVVTAVALTTGFFTAAKASEREAARLMLTMGYNLRIIAKEADPVSFLLTGIPDKTMPEQYLHTLAGARNISYNHLLATLQKKIQWQGMEVILTGLAPEICPLGQKKPPMIFAIDPGQLYVGYLVAEHAGLKPGDQVEINGKQFRISKCLSEAGGVDDLRIYCHLRDAQQLLQLPGRISVIKAVDCLCFAPTADPLQILRSQISTLLPGVQVFHSKAIATARSRTRQMVRNLFAVIVPFVVIACGVWIAVLAILNVRDRKQEIGVLRALGYDGGRIAVLFLGKAVLGGLLGAVVGFAVGTILAMHFGPAVFKITARTLIRPEPVVLVISMVAAPLFAAAFSLLPTALAVGYDPAVTLRDQ